MNLRGLSVRANRYVVQHRLIQRPFRLWAQLSLARHRVAPSEVTIVIVNWNSSKYLAVGLRAIARFSPPDTPVIVVDNGSTDDSTSVAAAYSNVRMVRLPRNVGHGTAADIGFLLARTEYVVSLDVDAFPIADGWVERLIEPLDRGYAVSGVHLRGGFVHPCCLAMRLEDFLSRGHTFTPRYGAGRVLARTADDITATGWDAGQKISLREKKRFLFERTGVTGPGDIGSHWAGLVYHNFYSTRFGSKLAPGQEEHDLGVSVATASAAWDRATALYLSDPRSGG